MNKQEIFNKVYLGLHSQGWKKSVDADGECFYRGDDGCKCAAGHLIPDEDYDPSMEGVIFATTSYFEKTPFLAFNQKHPELKKHAAFILRMQQKHDRSESPNDMKESFIELAVANDLTIPAV
jgi:hypothetical protein